MIIKIDIDMKAIKKKDNDGLYKKNAYYYYKKTILILFDNKIKTE
jgi:hypothetical protein